MKRNILLALYVIIGICCNATEISSETPGDTIYTSDIYTLRSIPENLNGIDFNIMMRCLDNEPEPQYFIGKVEFSPVKADLIQDYVGKMLMKFPDGTVLDKERVILTEPVAAYEQYISKKSTARRTIYMNVTGYLLTSQELEKLKNEGVSRVRVSQFSQIGNDFLTFDTDPENTKSIFNEAISQVFELKDGKLQPRGTYIQREVYGLENPLYFDF